MSADPQTDEERKTLYERLKPGDGIIVRFGSRGTQYAIVTRRSRSGTLFVRKWKAVSKSWIKHDVAIAAGELVRRAHLGEVQVTPIKLKGPIK